MALKIQELRKAAQDGEYVSDVAICLTADGELVEATNPKAKTLLVGAGSSIPMDLAERYGLLLKEEPAAESKRKKGAVEDKGA